MNSYTDFYKKITGFTPYEYQKNVAEILLNSDKNIILSVPTGAGKTWASIMPYLYARQCNYENFPQKLIYSLPLRTLTNSIYNDINEILNKDEIKGNYIFNNLTSIQTGEYSEDVYFEKDMIFATIDQTLSNFLCFPLSLSQRQANINAGALIGSYLIFDEFHLLDPQLSMSTLIGIIKMLEGISRFCLMTATLTDKFLNFFNENLNFEIVSLENFPKDKENIKSIIFNPNKNNTLNEQIHKKEIQVVNNTINVQNILREHKNKTIVICNRIETAQNLYLDLKKQKNDSTTLICIHSRYFDSDRQNKEKLIKEYFSKNSEKQDVILVSTQVLEAGMDISCDTMHTEISPINSFIQRAGRCARYENECGKIFVYNILDLSEKELVNVDSVNDIDKTEIKKLTIKYLPYDKETCEISFKELQQYDHLDESITKTIINDVLSKTEQNIIENIHAKSYSKEKIRKSWQDCTKNHYSETIRDIQSIDVVLLNIDNFKNKKIQPFIYETISVFRWSLIGWIKKIEQSIEEDEWIIAKAEQGLQSQFDFDWQDKESYFLRKLNTNDLKNYYDTVFISNKYFDYNDAGLIIQNNNNNNESPIKEYEKKEKGSIIFKKDTFYQHTLGLLNCYNQVFKPNLKYTINRLKKICPNINLELIIKLVLIFHDYGKLNKSWQEPMQKFQSKKTGIPCNEVLAHTDYDELTDKELAQNCGLNKKPSHAGIGAIQLYNMIFDLYNENIARASSSAILRHHSPLSDSFESFDIPEKYLIDIKNLINEIGIECEYIKKANGEDLKEILPNNDLEQIFYLFLVRILRLCDQKVAESLNKYMI
ncbi:MAG TPA: CRISPR-associated helicase Cas3' [bacterium]|nr:CRISPR-associated helicase Cas3' [Bacteroidales bacterium]HPZ74815.1 CRISPR-associated helicase Cas3' [Candidatus Pacearchaeota archaeon]HQL12254.1 CRISPR-associated helicase Cas3' [bacterium]